MIFELMLPGGTSLIEDKYYLSVGQQFRHIKGFR